jgi:hypothetical protein
MLNAGWLGFGEHIIYLAVELDCDSIEKSRIDGCKKSMLFKK